MGQREDGRVGFGVDTIYHSPSREPGVGIKSDFECRGACGSPERVDLTRDGCIPRPLLREPYTIGTAEKTSESNQVLYETVSDKLYMARSGGPLLSTTVCDKCVGDLLNIPDMDRVCECGLTTTEHARNGNRVVRTCPSAKLQQKRCGVSSYRTR